MKKIDILLEQIIPPILRLDGKDREWFCNDEIIKKLNHNELKQVENGLIERLKRDNDDLIPETLVKLNSINSLPVMIDRMKKAKDSFRKIKWASFIFEIKNDSEIENFAFKQFKKLEFIYNIQGVIFYDLIKFKSERINNLIAEYTNHKYPLVSIHAKKVLKLK